MPPNKKKKPRVYTVDQFANFSKRFIDGALRHEPDTDNGGLPFGFKRLPTGHVECNICQVRVTSAGVIPEHANGKAHVLRCLNYALKMQKKVLMENKDGIEITSAYDLKDQAGYIGFDVESDKKYGIDIIVKNVGNVPMFLLKSVLLKNIRIMKLANKNTKNIAIEIKPKESHKIQVSIKPKNIGRYNCPIAFMLSDRAKDGNRIHIVRYISAFCTNQLIKELGPKKPYKPPKKFVYREIGNKPIDGVPPPRQAEGGLEKDVPLNDFFIPKCIARVLNKGLNSDFPDNLKEEELDEIQAFRDVLGEELTIDNYSEKFSALLHVEEHQMNVDIRHYDMEGAIMEVHGKNRALLTLKVPGLAENRPSLLRGDKLFVKQYFEDKQDRPNLSEYCGYVHDVLETKVVLGFSQKLLDIFIPNMKFNVRFTFSRHPLKLHHRASKLAEEHRFKDILFPTPATSCRKELLQQDFLTVPLKFYDRNLEKNVQQARAVKHILAGTSRPAPYIIFGPPGTGKTVTMVEAMKQVWKNIPSSHILACAPSNSAADLIAQRLVGQKHIPKRDVFRMHAASRPFKSIPEEIRDCGNMDDDGSVTYPGKQDLLKYRFIVCTLTTAGRLASAMFPQDHFTHVFIDESGHAIEPEAVTAIAGILESEATKKYGQVVLCGDPRQLGPIVRSPIAKASGLGVSLLERLMNTRDIYARIEDQGKSEDANQDESKDIDHYNPWLITKLVNNYRSHPQILHLPNSMFYNGELQCAADKLLRSALCKWKRLPNNNEFPLLFHGVIGEDMREDRSPSFFNPQEVSLVKDHVKALMNARELQRLQAKDIGIITPYRKQVQKIQSVMAGDPKTKDIKVGTVEEFQGQERTVIIISTVRSNPDYTEFDSRYRLGFLRNEKRFNVSITRAKSLLIVIGNPFFLASDPHWNSLLNFMLEHNAYTGEDSYRERRGQENLGADFDDIIEHMKEMSLDELLSKGADTSALQQHVDLPWGGNEAGLAGYAYGHAIQGSTSKPLTSVQKKENAKAATLITQLKSTSMDMASEDQRFTWMTNWAITRDKIQKGLIPESGIKSGALDENNAEHFLAAIRGIQQTLLEDGNKMSDALANLRGVEKLFSKSRLSSIKDWLATVPEEQRLQQIFLINL